MITTILSGVILALVSGSAFLSYKHPSAYRFLVKILIIPLYMPFLFYCVWELGGIHWSIQELGKYLTKSENDKLIEVNAYVIRRMVQSTNRLTYMLAIVLIITIFIVFFYFLHDLIKISKPSKKSTRNK